MLTISAPKKVKVGVEIKAPKRVAGYAKIKYQWYRGSQKIKKATKRTLRITRADRGKSITCRVTLTPAGGVATVVMTTKPLKVPKK